jgi:hypothetical protein
MKLLFVVLFLVSLNGMAQVVEKDSVDAEEYVEQELDTVQLEEVVISKYKLDEESIKRFLLLQNRIYKVYPYAKIASERLVQLDKNMSKMKTAKEKKKYFKIVENYIEDEFTGRLKKLSRKQGQILVKLIYRQTGHTTFDLVKEYKSGWKAFWASNTAKLFDINLKSKYEPYEVNEDYLIETILVRAFKNGRLVEQKAAFPVDYEKLDEYWIERVKENRKKQAEAKKQ